MALGAAGFILLMMEMMDVGTAMMFTCVGMIAAGFGLFFAKQMMPDISVVSFSQHIYLT